MGDRISQFFKNLVRKREATTPKFVARMDKWLLLNSPLVWSSRIHIVLFYALVLWLLNMIFVYLAIPNDQSDTFISLKNVRIINLVTTGLLFFYWLYIQAFFNYKLYHGNTSFFHEVRVSVLFLLITVILCVAMLIPSLVYADKIEDVYFEGQWKELHYEIESPGIESPLSSTEIPFAGYDDLFDENDESNQLIKELTTPWINDNFLAFVNLEFQKEDGGDAALLEGFQVAGGESGDLSTKERLIDRIEYLKEISSKLLYEDDIEIYQRDLSVTEAQLADLEKAPLAISYRFEGLIDGRSDSTLKNGQDVIKHELLTRLEYKDTSLVRSSEKTGAEFKIKALRLDSALIREKEILRFCAFKYALENLHKKGQLTSINPDNYIDESTGFISGQGVRAFMEIIKESRVEDEFYYAKERKLAVTDPPYDLKIINELDNGLDEFSRDNRGHQEQFAVFSVFILLFSYIFFVSGFVLKYFNLRMYIIHFIIPLIVAIVLYLALTGGMNDYPWAYRYLLFGVLGMILVVIFGNNKWKTRITIWLTGLLPALVIIVPASIIEVFFNPVVHSSETTTITELTGTWDRPDYGTSKPYITSLMDEFITYRFEEFKPFDITSQDFLIWFSALMIIFLIIIPLLLKGIYRGYSAPRIS